ncbi:MAG: FecR family protein [Chitinophagaceae bacterium]|jgi:ferric-dicitrate binding protein FerR (iron transport regulator)|nr:FecR family protein [Chitinophagaceae bacterium]
MENRAWFLYSKKLTGEATVGEISELNDLLSRQPYLHDDLARLEAFWHARLPFDQEVLEADYQRLTEKMRSQGLVPEESNSAPSGLATVFVLSRRWYWAAAAILLMVAGFLFWPSPESVQGAMVTSSAPAPAQSHQVSTRPGSRTKVELPDGTQVWLNADSRLTYGNDFGKDTREVTLSGEAYFDVAPNKAVPFYIHTSKIRIKVTGTAFNVRAYPNEPSSETSLVHGKVEVILNGQPDKTYYLKPSEKLIVSETSVNQMGATQRLVGDQASRPALQEPTIARLVLDEIDQLPVETAWVNNKLAFSDESFREVANKMERWYGVDIAFAHPDLETIRFTGRFEEETLLEALKAMQLTARFRFEVNGNQVKISKQDP